MEGYYNNMFQQTARRGSAIDRITDPGTVTSYLCGYSLRICTLYLIWIHLIFNIFMLATLIIATTYVTISFKVVHEPNNTLYTVTVNNDKLISIDAFSEDLDVNMILIGHKIAQIFFGFIILDVCITIMALFGVYLNKLLLMVSYVVPIFTNILFYIILLIIEGVLAVFKVISWNWVSALILVVLLLKDFYRFVVLYSYFHMIGKHYFSSKPRTPQYLTTQSPHLLQTEMPTTLAPTLMTTESTTSPSIKSFDSDSSVENG